MKLSGKVAIVTGAAMGIGRTMAEGLAEEGAAVVIVDVYGADQTAAELKKKGINALGVKVDVTSEETPPEWPIRH